LLIDDDDDGVMSKDEDGRSEPGSSGGPEEMSMGEVATRELQREKKMNKQLIQEMENMAERFKKNEGIMK
jgi:hypothetical protein